LSKSIKSKGEENRISPINSEKKGIGINCRDGEATKQPSRSLGEIAQFQNGEAKELQIARLDKFQGEKVQGEPW